MPEVGGVSRLSAVLLCQISYLYLFHSLLLNKYDRAFDSCNPRLTKTLIDAAIASADTSTKIWVEKKEAEAAIAKARAESAAAEALAKLAAANARAEARPSRAERRKHKKTPVVTKSSAAPRSGRRAGE